MEARVTRISIAPIKGLGLRHPESVELGPRGVAEDRRLHLIDEAGRLVNGKKSLALMRVSPTLDLAANTLVLRFPEGHEVAGELATGERVTTSFYGRPVHGGIVTGPWAQALSDWAGIEMRLVLPDELGAAIDRGAGNSASIISEASIDDIARAGGADSLDGRRFRMTFELSGMEPYEEEGWIGRDVRIGDAVVRPKGNLGRCVVTTRDPDTTERDFDTLGVLASHRGDVETTEPLPLGVAGKVVTPGTVRVGDLVTLI
ncbi:MAG TPA: MOSC N-terminal beta barrel domain-containing protein [Gaiellales bacterium]|jgi:hypothetical protein